MREALWQTISSRSKGACSTPISRSLPRMGGSAAEGSAAASCPSSRYSTMTFTRGVTLTMRASGMASRHALRGDFGVVVSAVWLVRYMHARAFFVFLVVCTRKHIHTRTHRQRLVVLRVGAGRDQVRRGELQPLLPDQVQQQAHALRRGRQGREDGEAPVREAEHRHAVPHVRDAQDEGLCVWFVCVWWCLVLVCVWGGLGVWIRAQVPSHMQMWK